LLAAFAGVAIAVQQRGVAAKWRALAHETQQTASSARAELEQQLTSLRAERGELQKTVDKLASDQAERGDQAAAFSVLVKKASELRQQLRTCATASTWTEARGAPSCSDAANEAERILDALNHLVGD
jgi:peptidoglycan hydrolase CwlO-like protein